MSHLESGELLRALTFAAQKHKDQRRKDADASPYINHPIAVASVLATEAGVTDAVTLLAAILHDTVEDTKTTPEELEREFGLDIAGVVAEVTDDKALPNSLGVGNCSKAFFSVEDHGIFSLGRPWRNRDRA